MHQVITYDDLLAEHEEAVTYRTVHEQDMMDWYAAYLRQRLTDGDDSEL